MDVQLDRKRHALKPVRVNITNINLWVDKLTSDIEKSIYLLPGAQLSWFQCPKQIENHMRGTVQS